MIRVMKIQLRPAVARFAETMEIELRKHDAEKGAFGWLGQARTVHRLTDSLIDWAVGLKLDTDIGIPEDVTEDCVSVACYAMMIHDRISSLRDDMDLQRERHKEK